MISGFWIENLRNKSKKNALQTKPSQVPAHQWDSNLSIYICHKANHKNKSNSLKISDYLNKKRNPATRKKAVLPGIKL